MFVFNAATNDYTATYTVEIAGELEINVYFGGVHIAGSPRRVIVSAAPTSALLSVVSGSGTFGTIVGRSAGVTLQAYDSYSNIKSVGGDAFRVSIVPAVGPARYCPPRHRHVLCILVCRLKWHPMTWRAISATP